MSINLSAHALEIFACAIAQLAAAHAADTSVLDNDSFFQALWGACLYYQARSMSEVESDIEEARASLYFSNHYRPRNITMTSILIF